MTFGKRWGPGEAEIEKLLAEGGLEQVVPQDGHAEELLKTAEDFLANADETFAAGRLIPAYIEAWETIRRAQTSLLWKQGLRPTTQGGHVAVMRAALAQFGHENLERPLRRASRMRPRRNDLDYPTPETQNVDREEVSAALETARECYENAVKLIDHLPVWR